MPIARALILVAILIAGSPAVAQILSPIQVLPVAAKLSGSDGSSWVTDVTLSNATDHTMVVTAIFFRENRAGSIFPLPGNTAIVTLDPAETRTVEDVLAAWYPSQGETKGTVALFAVLLGADEGEPALLAASGRVYNAADPDFTYGQTVPSSLLSIASGAARVLLPGARWDERVRSNLGVVNISSDPVTVIVTVRAGDGTVIASGPRDLLGLSMSQWSLSQLGVDEMPASGRVEVALDPAFVGDGCPELPDDPLDVTGAAFLAYLSRVDRASGDAEMLLGQVDWSELGEDCEVPVPR